MPSFSSGVRRVHAVSKTHLDVGFTDQAHVVVDNYVHRFLPRVAEVNRQFERAGRVDRYVWTVGSWLMWEALERSSNAERATLEEAIAEGWIAWHGLPFTTHTEFLTRGLMERGLRLAHQLDERFSKRTIAAKLTDVPGHTRALVSMLADHGIEFLHIGINEALHAPTVPPLFRWVDRGARAAVTVALHQDYGGYCAPAGADAVLDIEVTSDNVGPSSPLAAFSRLEQLRRRYPSAQVNGSTLDAFAADIREISAELPLVTDEIGDSWIYGVGSDPRKVRGYRELARRYEDWSGRIRDAPTVESLDEFARRLLLVGEHTWGLDTIVYQPEQSYEQREFVEARERGAFASWERSWNEQREYLRYAIDALPVELAAEALQAIDVQDEDEGSEGGWTSYGDSADAVIENGRVRIRLDRHGALVALEDADGRLYDVGDGLGVVSYQLYGSAAYEIYRSHYVRQEKLAEWWIGRAFGKYALDSDRELVEAVAEGLAWRCVEKGDRLVVEVRLAVPMRDAPDDGVPTGIVVRYDIDRSRRSLTVTVSWREKRATLRPEAMWVSFAAPFAEATVAVRKLGRFIPIGDVVHGGAMSVHATDGAVRLAARDGETVEVRPLDSSLLAVGDRRLITDQGRRPEEASVHMNLFNNLWGTNFPQWVEGPQTFRFELSLAAATPADAGVREP